MHRLLAGSVLNETVKLEEPQTVGINPGDKIYLQIKRVDTAESFPVKIISNVLTIVE